MFEDEYLYFKDRASINTWCMAVSNFISVDKRNLVIGLDLEWSVYDGTSSIITLLQMSLQVGKTAFINLSLIKAFSKEGFPRNLKLLPTGAVRSKM